MGLSIVSDPFGSDGFQRTALLLSPGQSAISELQKRFDINKCIVIFMTIIRVIIRTGHKAKKP